MAREQRGSDVCVCVCIYVYILFTMEQEKKRKKQETDYNKILVGARTRDRIQIKEEIMREIRDLTARICCWLLLFFFLSNRIFKYFIPARLCYTHHD